MRRSKTWKFDTLFSIKMISGKVNQTAISFYLLRASVFLMLAFVLDLKNTLPPLLSGGKEVQEGRDPGLLMPQRE